MHRTQPSELVRSTRATHILKYSRAPKGSVYCTWQSQDAEKMEGKDTTSNGCATVEALCIRFKTRGTCWLEHMATGLQYLLSMCYTMWPWWLTCSSGHGMPPFKHMTASLAANMVKIKGDWSFILFSSFLERTISSAAQGEKGMVNSCFH